MTRDIKYPVPRVVVSTLEYVDDFFFFFETPFDTVEEGWHVSGRIQGLGPGVKWIFNAVAGFLFMAIVRLYVTQSFCSLFSYQCES